MKSLVLTGVCFVLILIAGTRSAEIPPGLLPKKELTEGEKPYTPTRLEWLVMELNLDDKQDMQRLSRVGFSFFNGGEDTVLIFIHHDNKSRIGDIEGFEKEANYRVRQAAKRHRWNWVKTEVKRTNLDEVAK